MGRLAPGLLRAPQGQTAEPLELFLILPPNFASAAALTAAKSIAVAPDFLLLDCVANDVLSALPPPASGAGLRI